MSNTRFRHNGDTIRRIETTDAASDRQAYWDALKNAGEEPGAAPRAPNPGTVYATGPHATKATPESASFGTRWTGTNDPIVSQAWERLERDLSTMTATQREAIVEKLRKYGGARNVVGNGQTADSERGLLESMNAANRRMWSGQADIAPPSDNIGDINRANREFWARQAG